MSVASISRELPMITAGNHATDKQRSITITHERRINNMSKDRAESTVAPDLIVMLTHEDQTVSNARQVFDSCADLPVTHWGYKDIGIEPGELMALGQQMHDAGSAVYLEVVSLDEKAALKAVELAANASCDIVCGTVYSDRIRDAVRDAGMDYYPFVGNVYGHPTILDGTPEEIAAHAADLTDSTVQGLDLLTYRHRGQPLDVLEAVVRATALPVVSAGSVQSIERIQEIWESGAAGLTIGSALFDGAFVPGGSFRENLEHVVKWMTESSRQGGFASNTHSAEAGRP